ncbi:DUF2461 domain-containing protein [Catenulispora yoronensis]|uniref:DUF2461 domain-containing protein n=1 Tax=Catenulispora yoronensis TaxID=450799 RepID=A0ABN2V8U6_9ACTN
MPRFAGFADEAYDFYLGLVADNSKSYWTEHKAVYERTVREPMQALLDQLAPTFRAEPSMFRPHRDIRFSKDKSPYKTHQAGFLSAARGVGYYLSLGIDGLTIGGGFYTLDREQTKRFRAAVDNDATGPELVTIVAKLEKHGFTIGGDQVRTRPRGVPADHPRLDLMRREYLTAGRDIDPSEAATPTFATTLKKDWQAMTPLVEWVMANAAPSLQEPE